MRTTGIISGFFHRNTGLFSLWKAAGPEVWI